MNQAIAWQSHGARLCPGSHWGQIRQWILSLIERPCDLTLLVPPSTITIDLNGVLRNPEAPGSDIAMCGTTREFAFLLFEPPSTFLSTFHPHPSGRVLR